MKLGPDCESHPILQSLTGKDTLRRTAYNSTRSLDNHMIHIQFPNYRCFFCYPTPGCQLWTNARPRGKCVAGQRVTCACWCVSCQIVQSGGAMSAKPANAPVNGRSKNQTCEKKSVHWTEVDCLPWLWRDTHWILKSCFRTLVLQGFISLFSFFLLDTILVAHVLVGQNSAMCHLVATIC